MSARSLSVVVPLRDGARHLGELLDALAAEPVDEVLVIDSGSHDESVDIARGAGVEVLEIPAEEFGHGRTRNLGAERTSGELIAFLTQDATPRPGWADAFRDAFALDERVGAAFGPHLPRPDTSPMIARELTEFFAAFAPDGRPTLQRSGDEPFLSNVNAAYLRACWEEIRFRDEPYAEDQAFGRDMLAAGWVKAFHPGATVLHAHDYGPLDFVRRYFDEYRGLRETAGHVEPLPGRSALRDVRAAVGADRDWLAHRGASPAERARWTVRSAVHHSGRRVGAALGSRSRRLPGALQRALSLERRDGAARRSALKVKHVGPARARDVHDAVSRLEREGPAPLRDPVAGQADRERLHIAVVIPPFQRGSGGHNTIFQLVSRLEAMGHTCSIWLDDPTGLQHGEWPAVVRQAITDFFAPVQAPVFKGFDDWYGADVLMATGWQTVYPSLLLDGVRARAYLVNDHEPDFYAESVERAWAARTYELGLHHIAASPWLRDLLIERYGASATDFELAVAHDIYRPLPVERRRDTVAVYARAATDRRAVPLVMLALEELHRRRPDLRFVLFGDREPPAATFPFEHAGIAEREQLAWLYSEATVGVCLSMTNFSLMPQEMLACGLPAVELQGVSAESIFGADGPLELAPLTVEGVAGAVQRLLEDAELWERRAAAGLEWVEARDWDHSARQVEAGLRTALREREGAAIG